MSTPALFASPETTVSEAARRMAVGAIGCLPIPVIDRDERLVGVVTYPGVVRALGAVTPSTVPRARHQR